MALWCFWAIQGAPIFPRASSRRSRAIPCRRHSNSRIARRERAWCGGLQARCRRSVEASTSLPFRTTLHPMTDAPDNLVLVYLRRLDEKMDGLREDLQEVKRRVTSLESAVAHLHGGQASLHSDFAGQSARMDRIEQRLD